MLEVPSTDVYLSCALYVTLHALAPPVPIIDSVEVAVLSLFEMEVNISLLTNGGQSVTQYTVSWCFGVQLSMCNLCYHGSHGKIICHAPCTVG